MARMLNVYEFYEQYDLEIAKMLPLRGHNITKHQFIAACKDLYEDIHKNNFHIQPRMMKWEIDERAKTINAKAFKLRECKHEIGLKHTVKLFQLHRKIISAKNNKIDKLKFYSTWIICSILSSWFLRELYLYLG